MAAEKQDVKLSGNNHLSIFALFLTFIFIVLILLFLKKKFQFTLNCLQFLLGGKEFQVQKTLIWNRTCVFIMSVTNLPDNLRHL